MEDGLIQNEDTFKLWTMDLGCLTTCVPSLIRFEVSREITPTMLKSIHAAKGSSLSVTREVLMKFPWLVNSYLKVFEVPSLKYNLLSISQLHDMGLTITFQLNQVTIKDRSDNVVALGDYTRGLPTLKNLVNHPACLSLSSNSND